MTLKDTAKSVALAVLILVGTLVQGHRGHAADLETLTVAGGCFWCVEADFEAMDGVAGAISGYTGGTVADPTYKQVTRGGTGHFEAVQILFDPDIVTRETLLRAFVRSVDPTDAGGQFCDRGDSYRTAMFVSDKDEMALARRVLDEAQTVLGRPVVTPVLDAEQFYPAEAYHQDYYMGTRLVLTRFGPKRQSEAYKAYREACGRDQRLRQLWGDQATPAGG